jgi:hypothetical protein
MGRCDRGRAGAIGDQSYVCQGGRLNSRKSRYSFLQFLKKCNPFLSGIPVPGRINREQNKPLRVEPQANRLQVYERTQEKSCADQQ